MQRALRILVVAVALAFPAMLRAQSTECSYAECALRVKFGILGGQSLIRAESGERLRGLGFPARGLDEVFEGSTVAQDLAETYQQRTNVGTVLAIAGFGAMLAWTATNYDTGLFEPYDHTWLWVGVPLTLGGALTISSGRDYLSQAVWEYNRQLPR